MSVYEFTEYCFDNAVTCSVLSKVNAAVNATAKLLTNSDILLGSHDFDSHSCNVSDIQRTKHASSCRGQHAVINRIMPKS